jgi:transcriptional regulator with XRE-family HTH domain
VADRWLWLDLRPLVAVKMHIPLESTEMAWVSKPGAVRYWRERACLTVPELAKRTGLSARTIYNIEREEHASHLETFNRVVDALRKVGCTMAAIATQVEDESTDVAATAQQTPRVVDDGAAPELGTLSRRAQRERRLELHHQVLRAGNEVFPLLGLDRFKRCLSRPHAHDGKRFAIHGVVDEYMGIPPAARKMLDCVDGGRFRVLRHVAPELLFYATVFAVTAEDANRLEAALDGEPISLVVRLLHAPPNGEWHGFLWFEKTPKPREFALVVEGFLDHAEVLKELPTELSEKG